jgi:hypothetical protein
MDEGLVGVKRAWERQVKTNAAEAPQRSVLSLISTHTGMMSSIVLSDMPLSLTGMFTDIGMAWAKGMGQFMCSRSGNRSENSDRSKLGDHMGSWIRAFLDRTPSLKCHSIGMDMASYKHAKKGNQKAIDLSDDMEGCLATKMSTATIGLPIKLSQE